MKYPVVLTRTEEGFSVSSPGLPGCSSQGTTEEEALSNIREAIAEYLAVARQIAGERDLREVEVPVWAVGKISGIPHLRAVKALRDKESTLWWRTAWELWPFRVTILWTRLRWAASFVTLA